MHSSFIRYAANADGGKGGRVRSGGIYLSALIVAQFAALIRYVILARLLGPEQLGIAVIIVLTAQVLDSITDAGADRFLIQDEEGDSPAALGMIHSVAIGRGILVALLLQVLAGPVASFFRVEGLAGALRAFAIVPLIGGFTNFHFRLQQRHHDFFPEAMLRIWSEIAGLAGTAIAAYVVRDYTAILYGLSARALVAALTSQYLAGGNYRFSYSRTLARRLARFSGPLVVSGIVMFIGSQSDRFVIGNTLGTTVLGQYSGVFLLIMYPSAMAQRFLSGTLLPKVSRAEDRTQAMRELESIAVLVSTLMLCGFVVVAPIAIPLLYGNAFKVSLVVIGLIGVLQSIRFLRFWPALEGLATGSTATVMASNVVRVASLPIAVVAASFGRDLRWILLSYIAGELVALFVGLAGMNRVTGRKPTWGFASSLLFSALAAAVACATEAVDQRLLILAGASAALASICALSIILRNRFAMSSVIELLLPKRAHS